MTDERESGIKLEELLHRIEYAECEEIDPIIDAIQRRFRRLCPGWEVVFQAYPVKEPENCRKPQIKLLDKKP